MYGSCVLRRIVFKFHIISFVRALATPDLHRPRNNCVSTSGALRLQLNISSYQTHFSSVCIAGVLYEEQIQSQSTTPPGNTIFHWEISLWEQRFSSLDAPGVLLSAVCCSHTTSPPPLVLRHQTMPRTGSLITSASQDRVVYIQHIHHAGSLLEHFISGISQGCGVWLACYYWQISCLCYYFIFSLKLYCS